MNIYCTRCQNSTWNAIENDGNDRNNIYLFRPGEYYRALYLCNSNKSKYNLSTFHWLIAGCILWQHWKITCVWHGFVSSIPTLNPARIPVTTHFFRKIPPNIGEAFKEEKEIDIIKNPFYLRLASMSANERQYKILTQRDLRY